VVQEPSKVLDISVRANQSPVGSRPGTWVAFSEKRWPQDPGTPIQGNHGVRCICKTKDRTTLTNPDSLKAARGALKEGAWVKATYEQRSGEEVATWIEARLEDKKPKSQRGGLNQEVRS
jgi:hypothetical protein